MLIPLRNFLMLSSQLPDRTRKHTTQNLCMVFVVLLLANTSLPAQVSGNGRVYSLNDCLGIAAEKNLDVISGTFQYQSQTAEVRQAFGSFLPTITANLGYSRQLNVEGGRTVNVGGQVFNLGGVQPNSYNMGAFASYNIFNGFARESNYNRAQQELNATEQTLKRTKQNVNYLVRSQYIAVLRAMQVLKIRQENVELGKKELERMKALNEAGRVPVGNVYSAEADLGSRELEVINAENQLNQAKAQLLSTLALPPEQQAEFLESSLPVTVSPSDISLFRTDIGNLSSAVTTALRTRFDYIAVTHRMESAASSVTAARGSYMPSISASGGWSWSNTAFENFSDNGRYFMSFNVSVPVFDNFNASTQVQQATIQEQLRDIERRQLEQRVRTEVQSSFLNLESAEKQLEITSRAIRSAEQNFNSAKERIAVGSASILDYLTANNQAVVSRINRVNAVYNYYDAQNQVRFMTGMLTFK
jgi:outer membrane protein